MGVRTFFGILSTRDWFPIYTLENLPHRKYPPSLKITQKNLKNEMLFSIVNSGENSPHKNSPLCLKMLTSFPEISFHIEHIFSSVVLLSSPES